MDKQIQKLKNLVENHLYQSKDELKSIFGNPSKRSDDEIWFISKRKWLIFRKEIIFIFDNNKVVDIALSEYILWAEYRRIFYYQNSVPEYKIQNLIF